MDSESEVELERWLETLRGEFYSTIQLLYCSTVMGDVFGVGRGIGRNDPQTHWWSVLETRCPESGWSGGLYFIPREEID